MNDLFSRRLGVSASPADITIREDATPYFRRAVAEEATERDVGPHSLREIICKLVRAVPDPDNWSAYPNVWDETTSHLASCDWYRVYDFAELVYALLTRSGKDAPGYQRALNDICIETGIGWQMVNGKFQTRGDVGFESTVHRALELLQGSARRTAASELAEAVQDLSKRPKPDKTGAIQHAMAALECLGRDVVGDHKPTLGELMKRYRDELAIPQPLDHAIEKAWGYASEVGRHLREGREPGRAEAELVVALSAAMCAYLLRDMADTVDSSSPNPFPF
ncbi:AbiJ-NTD4 domain-containing protein [Anaeromyxobacter dehalogenans]|uniref:AbiJ-NTD4 domain-containing protein n=1 Tax=Anaeromyxobacter dehalogenans TaxID=161493 RepID=UPI000673DD6B|nr:hypothetical protein [Anaeromyxobacter dehalogenans]